MKTIYQKRKNSFDIFRSSLIVSFEPFRQTLETNIRNTQSFIRTNSRLQTVYVPRNCCCLFHGQTERRCSNLEMSRFESFNFKETETKKQEADVRLFPANDLATEGVNEED